MNNISKDKEKLKKESLKISIKQESVKRDNKIKQNKTKGEIHTNNGFHVRENHGEVFKYAVEKYFEGETKMCTVVRV